MTTNKPQNANFILDRLKKAYGLKYDTEIADFLGKDPSTISTWRRRGTVDYTTIFSKCHDINANYIIYGEMPIKKSALSIESHSLVNEPKKGYRIKNIIESIEALSINPEEKMELLKMYLKILKEKEGETRD
ncbi:MAG: helix-turn-helix domain containing protein [Gracilimonas sp.]|uniref:helix-turn-helix domain-containing protein n=1 Tax=Gracilimonas sp. TaxID=1974203 RepID=UPI003753277F|nr:helix-turn-helix domain containing protein [Gracilimonas sp.]